MSKKYVSKLLEIANAELGYLEKKSNKDLYSKTGNAGSANYTKYAYEFDTKYSGFYNGKKNGFAWCDVFVDWCFVTAFGVEEAKKLLCQPEKSLGAGCKYSRDYYKAKGQHYTTPKVGDQIFFYDSSKKGIAHTGLVYKVDSTYVYTIEGNTSSTRDYYTKCLLGHNHKDVTHDIYTQAFVKDLKSEIEKIKFL